MLYYLIQTTAAHPDLSRGIPPAGLLNAAEQRTFCALSTPNRRRDWLLGRWTAKCLLQAFVAQTCGESRTLDSFTIINTPNGAPRGTDPCLSHLTLSLSQRDDYAFCMLSDDGAAEGAPAGAVGAAVERIASHRALLVDDYFTGTEMARVRGAPLAACDLLTTAIWSAKEATLQALRLGLTVDARTVTCEIAPFASPPTIWTSFNVCYDTLPLNRQRSPLRGWWRVFDDYVLTLVAAEAVCHSADQLLSVQGEPWLGLHLARPVASELVL